MSGLLLAAAAPLRAQALPDTLAGGLDATQRDLLDVLFGRKRGDIGAMARAEPKVQRSILPFIGSNPALGFVGGIAANSTWRGGDPATTSISSAVASAAYTTFGQLLTSLKTNVFLPDNRFNFQGDVRYYDTKQPTYGLGPDRPAAGRSEMDFQLLRVHGTLYRSVGGPLFAGVGYHLDRFAGVSATPAAGQPTSPYADYYGGAPPDVETASGLSFDFLYDTRDNPINPATGYYATAGLRWYTRSQGSTRAWQAFVGEFRAYPKVAERTVLAFWGYTWFTFGRAPYLALPAANWDTYSRASRGLTQGRVRGTSQAYGEVEVRQGLTADGLFGVVGFFNALTTVEPGTGELSGFDPGFGVGLRLKLNKRSRTNIALDYGFNRSGSGGLFVNVGEAF
ncbi:MAG: hypothetical protein NW201_07895 [Gemmatimonadales bacterium]|nr:hypothetical protein [Gemmatimonadales bacterium]